jgi:hypothetical protein
MVVMVRDGGGGERCSLPFTVVMIQAKKDFL